MKALTEFINNSKEMQQGEDLGVEVKPQYNLDEFYFDKSYIHAAFLTEDRDCVVIFLPSGRWDLKYSKELWEEVKNAIQENENRKD